MVPNGSWLLIVLRLPRVNTRRTAEYAGGFWRVTTIVALWPSNAYGQATPMAKQRLWPSNAYGQATPMAKQRLWPSNAYGQATPMAKQRLWPSNARRWPHQSCPMKFGGVFLHWPNCVPDSLGLRCTMSVLCVREADLAMRAFAACVAPWLSKWCTMCWMKLGWRCTTYSPMVTRAAVLLLAPPP